jgi:hypothetical protein
MTVYHQNDSAGAKEMFESSLKIKESLGDKWGIATTLVYLANISRNAGDLSKTRDLLAQSLNLKLEMSDVGGIADTLDGFAALAVAERQPDRAARLFGAAETIRETSNNFLHATDRVERDRSVNVLQKQLTPSQFDTAWRAGHTLTLEQAVAEALKH